MTISDTRRQQIELLKKAGFVHAEKEVDLILEHKLAVTKLDQLKEKFSLTTKQSNLLSEAVSRRLKGEPLAYILGTQAFRDLTLKVDKRALIPRSETELLVSLVLENKPQKVTKIIEIGTGSGAVAISLKKLFPQAEVVATDVSEDALSLAEENAANQNVELTLVKSDLLQAVKKETYDVIVANLPYVPEGQLSFVSDQILDWEPIVAISGGQTGLKLISQFIEQLADYVDRNTVIGLEMWHTHGQEITELLSKSLPQKTSQIYQDLASFERFVICR